MKFGGVHMRSTSDWSSQGGKLPRCVLPRTCGAKRPGRVQPDSSPTDSHIGALASVANAATSRHCRQVRSRKAAQTSSVAARLPARKAPHHRAPEPHVRAQPPGGFSIAATGRSHQVRSLQRAVPCSLALAPLPSVGGATVTLKRLGCADSACLSSRCPSSPCHYVTPESCVKCRKAGELGRCIERSKRTMMSE
jgi:hypothetical protein